MGGTDLTILVAEAYSLFERLRAERRSMLDFLKDDLARYRSRVGRADQVKGKVQNTVGGIKDKIRDADDRSKDSKE